MVREQTTERRGDQIVWLCWCECGEIVHTTSYLLTSGKTKSCGCLRQEMGVLLGEASIRHGEGSNGKETSEYQCWGQMKSRCANPNHGQYSHYGARGIAVCKRWRDSYELFLLDMGRRPTPGHSLDRINNDGNYTPKNCRWATRQEQNQNTRRNKKITIDGQEKVLAEWLRQMKVSRTTYYRRLRAGRTSEEALLMG